MSEGTRLIVGPQQSHDSNAVMQRGDAYNQGMVGHAYGKYQEMALRGNLFMCSNAAGVTSQAGISATTPVLTLYNPAGSGIRAALIYAGATFSVAFATAGAIWLCANTNVAAAAVTGTNSTLMKNCLLGGAAPALTPLLAATLPAAPTGIDLLGVGLTGAITTIPFVQAVGKWYEGSIILAPGTAISIQTGVASGASGMFCTYMWQEIPIVV